MNQGRLNPHVAFANLLKEVTFPADKLPSIWKEFVFVALKFTSPASMGVSVSDYRALFTADMAALSLMQVAVLNNTLEQRTMHELGIDYKEYCGLMQNVENVAIVYNSITKPLREGLEQQMAREFMEDRLDIKPANA